jgi:hypothetical protein
VTLADRPSEHQESGSNQLLTPLSEIGESRAGDRSGALDAEIAASLSHLT